jgi:hypothetical protein
MTVTIGVDAHKATHTAVAIDGNERPMCSVGGDGGPMPDPAAVGVGSAVG